MPQQPLRILITGSRDWVDADLIHEAIEQYTKTGRPVVVVHGGARGADRLAGAVADSLGLDVEVHPADWRRHGRSAGYIRNAEMVSAGADVCLAFIRAGSSGATHCAASAERAGIQTIRYEASTA